MKDREVTGTIRPARFYAHHGSLSKELRTAAELALHEQPDTVTACTSTLELGVDLPDLDLVVQVDTCLSVAGLRQRLGRSGRREGQRPVLKVYETAVCPATGADPGPPLTLRQRLRMSLVQSVATIELIGEDWVEPTDDRPLGMSTLIHQVVCLLTDPDGRTAAELYGTLCQAGPWRRVTPEMFGTLLRSLAGHGLVRQDEDKRLLLDEDGHALSRRRDFLAVFSTRQEYVLKHRGKELGALPFLAALSVGDTVAFAGRTWEVCGVQAGGWVVDVLPCPGGQPPRFFGGLGNVHARVRQTMAEVYAGDDIPGYLDETAAEMLTEGRREFKALGLDRSSLAVADDAPALLALWTGDRELVTAARWFESVHPEVKVTVTPVGLMLPGCGTDTVELLDAVLAQVPDPLALADGVLVTAVAKHDRLLPPALRRMEYASRAFDVPAAEVALRAARARC